MKNSIKRPLVCLMSGLMLVPAVACKAGSNNPNNNAGKNTLYVYSFTSGYGDEWLKSLIADYEAAHTDVHIEPTTEKSSVAGADMRGRNEVVYFLEQQDYYEMRAGNYIADITEAITTASPYDGKTLESKMFDDQKSYLGRNVNGETRYYAYPHYLTTFGIVYDVELFDAKGYYFVEGYESKQSLSSKFIGAYGGTKSAGPNKKAGDSDDGLPTTYEEFLWLCEYIDGTGDNPLIWSGEHRDSYLMHFINALATDYNGYDQMRLNYTFDGWATNLGRIVDGVFVEDAEDTKIDGTNGYELARQAGKYYAIDFYEDLYNQSYIKSKTETLFGDKYSHTKAQEDFLLKSSTRNAMLLDGCWWQQEATAVFDRTSTGAPENSKQNRHLGWMPLPKATKDMVDGSSTIYDIYYPLCMMKNGLDSESWEYKTAIDFIQFANSDEQLAKFAQITGATKALNYSMDESKLSYFGKSFYTQYKNSKVVFPYDNNLLFENNQKAFQSLDWGTGSPLYRSTGIHPCVIASIKAGAKTAAEWFSGMETYFKDLKIWKAATKS